MIYRMASRETKPKKPTDITVRDAAYTAPGAVAQTHWFVTAAQANDSPPAVAVAVAVASTAATVTAEQTAPL